jgi:hypothetical protein
MRKALFKVSAVSFATVLGIVALTGQARAAGVGTPVVAVPGSFQVGFATPQAVVQAGGILPLVSVDIAPHNLCIRSGPSDGDPPIGCSSTVSIAGGAIDAPTGSLVAGNDYAFYCGIHPSTMKGVLHVVMGV